MRYTIPGPFAAQDLGRGLWQLTATGAAPTAEDPAQIYLRTAAAAAPTLRDGGVTELELDWHREGVSATMIGTRGASRLALRTAIVHEPQSRLYEQLPLAAFDRNAMRFWKRVFMLMRIPGGRFLLKFVAKQRR